MLFGEATLENVLLLIIIIIIIITTSLFSFNSDISLGRGWVTDSPAVFRFIFVMKHIDIVN